MSAAPSCRSGSPAPPLTYWANRDEMKLFNGFKVVKLPEKLALMMDLLLEKPGECVSRERFLYHLWTAQGEEEPDTSDACLSHFFHRLRVDKGVDIENVRTCGWKLPSDVQEYQPGRRYKGSGEVGSFDLLRIVKEPMLLLRCPKTGEEMHIPLSGARMMGLTEIEAGA